MDHQQRNLITRNVNLLTEPGILSYEKIRPYVLGLRVFTLRMIEDIDAEETDVKRLHKLLLDLCTRGPLAFHKFIHILRLTGHYDAITILLPGGNHINSEGNSRVMGRSEVDNYIPFPDSLKISEVPVVGGSIKEKEASVFPRVKLAERWIEGDNIYKMSSEPRGLCFILNNFNFTKPDREDRKGSERNLMFLKIVFKDLGFIVETHEDKTAAEIKSLLEAFASREEHYRLDACVVILMSHGKKKSVEGIHGDLVNLDDVYELFNNNSCPGLINKPKIFIINACRGDCLDYGASIPPNRLVSSDGTPLQTYRVPVWTDMLFCYCTVEGSAAVRDPEYGSWFIHYLVKVLMEMAWNTDFQTMLEEVGRELHKAIGRHGEKQSAETNNLGFNKKLYFNPGLYRIP